MTHHPWMENEYGLWCPSCGDLVVPEWNLENREEGDDIPENCSQCGFPYDIEAMAEYHT